MEPIYSFLFLKFYFLTYFLWSPIFFWLVCSQYGFQSPAPKRKVSFPRRRKQVPNQKIKRQISRHRKGTIKLGTESSASGSTFEWCHYSREGYFLRQHCRRPKWSPEDFHLELARKVQAEERAAFCQIEESFNRHGEWFWWCWKRYFCQSVHDPNTKRGVADIVKRLAQYITTFSDPNPWWLGQRQFWQLCWFFQYLSARAFTEHDIPRYHTVPFNQRGESCIKFLLEWESVYTN